MSLEGRLGVTTAGGVEFAFTVTNASPEAVTLSFPSGQVVDVAVLDDGKELWRWSDDRVFTQAIGSETLEPGESFVASVTWEDPRPGTYTAVASLAAENYELEARTEFSW